MPLSPNAIGCWTAVHACQPPRGTDNLWAESCPSRTAPRHIVFSRDRPPQLNAYRAHLNALVRRRERAGHTAAPDGAPWRRNPSVPPNNSRAHRQRPFATIAGMIPTSTPRSTPSRACRNSRHVGSPRGGRGAARARPDRRHPRLFDDRLAAALAFGPSRATDRQGSDAAAETLGPLTA